MLEEEEAGIETNDSHQGYMQRINEGKKQNVNESKPE